MAEEFYLRVYAKHKTGRTFKAMDLGRGTTVDSLMYASYVSSTKLDTLRAHVKKMSEDNPDWTFQIRHAETNKVFPYEDATPNEEAKNNPLKTQLSQQRPKIKGREWEMMDDIKPNRVRIRARQRDGRWVWCAQRDGKLTFQKTRNNASVYNTAQAIAQIKRDAQWYESQGLYVEVVDAENTRCLVYTPCYK